MRTVAAAENWPEFVENVRAGNSLTEQQCDDDSNEAVIDVLFVDNAILRFFSYHLAYDSAKNYANLMGTGEICF